nr:ShlB/FhaC/HecB family hemolysin secretion/activation protein [cf. Phormidesmis sp. LEGE 11477]
MNVPDLPPDGIPEIPSTESTLFVTAFTFVGNTVFSDEQLQAIAQPYTGRRITFSDLFELRSRITDLYLQNDYITSGAYVPLEANQNVDPSAANITLQVIEGGVEQIEVAGDRRLEAYVRRRIAPATAAPLSRSKLEEALRLLQVDPLVDSVSGNLSPGSQTGLSILEIEAVGEPIFALSAGTDNRRLPSVGSVQGQTSLSASNLLGAGERVSFGYSLTEGSDAFDVQLAAPVNARNGTLSFQYASIDGQIVEEPIDEFDIRTDSRSYSLSFEQPILRRATDSVIDEFVVGIRGTRVNSQATLAGFPFPLSPGANDNGVTRTAELTAFQAYSRRTGNEALFISSQFDVGIDAFNATVGEEPDAQYITWGGQVAWIQRFSNSSELRLRGKVQLSGEPLIPFSQFSIGGPSSVRGYRQGALLADSGVSGTAEVLFPILQTREQELSLIPFAGVGVGWNNGRERALDDNFLAAVGLGTQYTWNDFSARINYAVPFTDVGTTGNSLQENGIDFEVRYQLRF